MPGSDDLTRRVRALFLEELDDALEVLDRTVVTLGQAGPEETVGAVRELFRCAHSVKGAAQAAGAPDVVRAAHRLEDRFGALRDGEVAVDDGLVRELLALVDELRAARDAEVHGDHPGAAPTVVAPSTAPRPIRVDGAKVDVLREDAQDLVGLAGRLGAIAHADRVNTLALRVELLDVARSVLRLTNDLAATATSLSFLPFEAVCAGLARAVHEVAAPAGKRARLQVRGGQVEADRTVLGALRDPLLQLVRNAVAHGIETPDRRRAAGKPEQGTVTVAAELDGAQLVVTVHDDGAGIDQAALRSAASDRDLDADADPAELAFAPGVSTARSTTEGAGRGVGLDVVRSGVQAVGGSVRLASTPTGTLATITVPATLALLRCLRAEVAGTSVLVPLASLHRIVRCPAEGLVDVAGRAAVVVEDVAVPVASLATAAALAEDAPLGGSTLLLVVEDGSGLVALAVDELLDEAEVALRPPPPRLAGLDEILGTATVSGLALPVLNLVACARRARQRPHDLAAAATPEPTGPTRVLVVDDTVTTRTLEAGILAAAGYEVLTAGDGEEAWELLQREAVDVVLADVHMPRLDGIELCRRIRASDRWADLPVIIVSSLGSVEDRRAGLDAGATAYVVKSEFDQHALVELLERVR